MDIPIKDKRRVISLYIRLEILSEAAYYEVNGIPTDFQENKQYFEKSLFKFANLKRQNPLMSSKLLQEIKITNLDRKEALKKPNLPLEKVMPQDPYTPDGETLLLKALSIQHTGYEERDDTLSEIIDLLIKYCPGMITVERQDKHGNYTGITPIHLAILKQDDKLLDNMLYKVKENVNDTINFNQNGNATGKCCTNTIMMAGFPLAVAVLTLNKKIVSLLLQSSDVETILQINDTGDNVIHSLIRQAARCPEKVTGTLEMINYLVPHKETGNNKNDAGITRKRSHQLLMMMNREKLTPLQLATKLKQHEIFKFIISSEVYRSTDTSGGMIEEEKYDITEIETIGIVHENEMYTKNNINIQDEHHVCILEHLINQEPSVAFNIADVVAVREVIRIKWNTYRMLFYSWFFIHICFMTLITACGVRRSYIFASDFENGLSNDPGKPNFKIKVKDNALFLSGTSIGLVMGLFYITIEIFRSGIYRKFPLSTYIKMHNFKSPRPYSDFTFRVLFIVFAVLLIIDFGAAFSDSYEHYCLIFAIVIGWYIILFFLKTLEPFSFFAILIERALIELVKFAIVMGVLLIAFSAAMYMVMQGAKNMDSEESFRHFKFTILKMFMIMVGLGDLSVLFNARHPIMSVAIFIMFVLLTTILLLNAFLALMSEICTELINSRNNVSSIKIHTRLHKLSAILFIEGMLPICLCKEVGTIKKVCRFDTEWKASVPRRFLTTTEIKENVPKFKHAESRSIASTTLQGETDKEAQRSRKITNKVYDESRRATRKIAENGKSVQRLEVKDVTKQTSDNCGEEALTNTQTQKITENGNVLEEERNEQIEMEGKSVDS